LYTVDTGSSTSMDFSTVDIGNLLGPLT
jgi:hypothetical protein